VDVKTKQATRKEEQNLIQYCTMMKGEIVPQKHQKPWTRLHGVTSEEIVIVFLVVIVKASNRKKKTHLCTFWKQPKMSGDVSPSFGTVMSHSVMRRCNFTSGCTTHLVTALDAGSNAFCKTYLVSLNSRGI
jgi:hypothetical protein